MKEKIIRVKDRLGKSKIWVEYNEKLVIIHYCHELFTDGSNVHISLTRTEFNKIKELVKEQENDS